MDDVNTKTKILQNLIILIYEFLEIQLLMVMYQKKYDLPN